MQSPIWKYGRLLAFLLLFTGVGCSPPCLDPTPEQCIDPAWMETSCGAEERARIRRDAPGIVCLDLCPETDEAWCADEQWQASACGQLEGMRYRRWLQAEVARAQGHPGAPNDDERDRLRAASACAEAIDEWVPDNAIAREVVRPGGLFDAEDDDTFAEETMLVFDEPYGRENQGFEGGDSLYHAAVLERWTRDSSVSPLPPGIWQIQGPPPPGGWPVALDEERDTWERNGSAASSCMEYVYERFYDYSLFESTISRDGGSPRAVVDRAFAGRDAAQPPRSAIGTWALRGEPQASLDGVVLDQQIEFLDHERPRNVFFDVGLAPADVRAVILERIEPDDGQPGCGTSLEGLLICDDALRALLEAGQGQTHQESWAWHDDMNRQTAAEGFSDDAMELGRRKVAALEKMLVARQKVVQEIRRGYGGLVPVENAERLGQIARELGLEPGQPIEQRLPHDQISRQLNRQELIRDNWLDLRAMGHAVLREDGLERTSYRPYARNREEWFNIGPLYPPRVQRLYNRLRQIDTEIERYLLDARSFGCLQPDRVGPCDWAPSMLAERLANRYIIDREMAYQRCLDNTPDGFAALAGRDFGLEVEGEEQYPVLLRPDGWLVCHLGPDGTPGAPPGDSCPHCNRWTSSPTALETYFDCASAFRQMVMYTGQALLARERELGDDLITSEGELRLQGSGGDRMRAGSDLLNVTAAYGAGWSLGHFDDYVREVEERREPCRLSPEAYAFTRLHANLVGIGIEILEASAHLALREPGSDLTAPAGVTHDRLEFSVLGREIVGVDLGDGWQEPFDIAVEDLSRSLGSATVAQWGIDIWGIFIGLDLGVAARVGLRYSASGEAFADDCSAFRLVGEFVPNAGIDLIARAGLDVLIAEVQARSTLTLIDILLPFTAELQLGLDDRDRLSLFAHVGADLILDFLSGSITLYGRFLIWDRRATVFRWNGPDVEVNLFEHGFHLPLLAFEGLAAFLDQQDRD